MYLQVFLFFLAFSNLKVEIVDEIYFIENDNYLHRSLIHVKTISLRLKTNGKYFSEAIVNPNLEI